MRFFEAVAHDFCDFAFGSVGKGWEDRAVACPAGTVAGVGVTRLGKSK